VSKSSFLDRRRAAGQHCREAAVIDSAEERPGECISIEVD
jgi:hypothetical protein